MRDRHWVTSRLAAGAAGLWAGYFFLVWSGLGLPGLSHEFYDQWRQAQLLVLLALWGLVALWLGWGAVAARPVPAPGRRGVTGALLVLPVGWALLVLLAGRWPWPTPVAAATQRALADLGLWLSVGAAMPLLAGLLASAAGHAGPAPRAAWLDNLAAWMSLMPVMGTPTLVFHVYDALTLHVVSGRWHYAFAGERHYDDALLPCLLLLWLRPGWLAAPRCSGLVLAVSAWYLFSLVVDGARGDMLCLAVALGVSAGLGRRRAWPLLRTALVAGGLAGLGAALLQRFGAPPTIALARAGSSGRLAHWQAIFELVRQRTPYQLMTGFGGDGLLAAMAPFGRAADEIHWKTSSIAHPHNMPMQWLTEWGLAGVALCGLALLPLGWFWRHRSSLPVLGFGAVLALYCDGLFSGFWIYPQSQMMGLWLMAWLVAVGRSRAADPRGSPVAAGQGSTSTLLCFAALGSGLSLLMFVHARDLLAAPGYEIPGSWPRFWVDGAMLHLPPARSVPAGSPRSP